MSDAPPATLVLLDDQDTTKNEPRILKPRLYLRLTGRLRVTSLSMHFRHTGTSSRKPRPGFKLLIDALPVAADDVTQ